jgi:hypothetical protein
MLAQTSVSEKSVCLSLSVFLYLVLGLHSSGHEHTTAMAPNVVVEWLKLLLHIVWFPGLNLGLKRLAVLNEFYGFPQSL